VHLLSSVLSRHASEGNSNHVPTLRRIISFILNRSAVGTTINNKMTRLGVAVLCAAYCCGAEAQTRSFRAASEDNTEVTEIVRACAQVSCRGKRIAHGSGYFQFCIPRGMRYRRVAGFEGDIHDRITLRIHGESSELVIFKGSPTWGPVKSFPGDWPPVDPTRADFVSRQWRCSEGTGQDFRLHRNDRHWRLVAFPIGFAEYKNVPSRAAEKFDLVLDSLCCQNF
jgi:hypothetical protein